MPILLVIVAAIWIIIGLGVGLKTIRTENEYLFGPNAVRTAASAPAAGLMLLLHIPLCAVLGPIAYFYWRFFVSIH